MQRQEEWVRLGVEQAKVTILCRTRAQVLAIEIDIDIDIDIDIHIDWGAVCMYKVPISRSRAQVLAACVFIDLCIYRYRFR